MRGTICRSLPLTLILAITLTATAITTCSAQDTDRKTLREELQLLTAEVEKAPDNIDLRLRKAACCIELNEWERAKVEYDYILDRDPNNLSALFYRAYTNTRLNRLPFARNDYEAMLKIIPYHFEAQLGLALVNQKDGRPAEALNQMNLLVEQNTDNALAYAARGGMEVEQGLLELAEYDYSQALSLDEDNTDYLLNRADIRLRLGKHKEAKTDLDTLVDLGINRASLTEFYNRLK